MITLIKSNSVFKTKALFKWLPFAFAFIILGCTNKPIKTNVIFIITDDMYPDMFNNLPSGITEDGKPKNLTPSLDLLIKEGVWLENMKVVSPICTPSRYNCLTGNYASRSTSQSFLRTTEKNEGQTVIQWNSFIVPGQEKTMGNYFQHLGYVTGFVGKNHVIESLAQIGESNPPELDADLGDPKVKEGLEYRYCELQKDIQKSGFNYSEGLYNDNPSYLGIRALDFHNMDWITAKGLDFIDTYKNEPFLLYFATTLPHAPFNAQQSWQADRRITPRGKLDKSPDVLPLYKDKWLSEKDQLAIAQDPEIETSIRNSMSLKRRIEKSKIQGKYKENLLWLDDAIGAIFQKLKKNGLLDNTIIVFFNDHGQELKGTLYEGGISSQAFIWKKGGFKVGNRLTVPVSNVDFLPTLLELVGDTEHLGNFDGYSFKSALDNNGYKGRSSMYHELGFARAVVKDNFKYYAVRYPKGALSLTFEERKMMLHKYNELKKYFGRPISNADPSDPYGHLMMIPGGESAEHVAYTTMPYYSDPDQFYDLKNDPHEQHNLFNNPMYADKIKELQQELREYIAKLPGHFDR
jgi:arylsulfatase A-like enzyme